MADKNNKGYGVPAAPAVPASPAKPAAPAAPAGRPGKSADDASLDVREVSAKERIDARRRTLEKKLTAQAPAGSSEARKSSPSAASRAYAETSPQVGSSPTRATPPAGAGKRPAAAPFLEEHPHPKGVSDRLRRTIVHTTSGRPKDAFGKGMKKPQSTVGVEGGKPASPEETPKKKSCLGSIFGIIIALILISQVGSCAASCVGDIADSFDNDTSSWFDDSGSERQDGSSSSMNSFSNDEADEAAALASAREALASLDSHEKIVDRIAQGINARYVKMFGFSADDAGIDSKELARWFIEGASCTVGDDDVFVYTDGTADVFADCTSVPVYNFVSAVDNAARSLAAGSRTSTKQQVAAATETAKGHVSSEYSFIMFSLVKTDAGWVLDEDDFVSNTADHLFGL